MPPHSQRRFSALLLDRKVRDTTPEGNDIATEKRNPQVSPEAMTGGSLSGGLNTAEMAAKLYNHLPACVLE